ITRALMGWGLATKHDLTETINDMRTERAAKAAARKVPPILPALSIPAKSDTRTALSTARDGLARPAKPLSRPPRKVTKDYLDSLIRAQIDRVMIDRCRRHVGQQRTRVTSLSPVHVTNLSNQPAPDRT
ncbi:hypothetical protein, partial [Filomicrobium sp.]|uniref:hypothetical protein n=1 Tax=Filomicrobium sp. TaxID=2024831 RepID=UPI0025857440